MEQRFALESVDHPPRHRNPLDDGRDRDRIGRREHRGQREGDRHGIAGISQWMKRPIPSTVNRTSPSASWMTAPRSLNSSSGGRRQPLRNSSGGRKSRKKTCGIERDDKLTGQADHRANSDLDQGARIANGDMRERTSLSTTARKNRVTATLSIVCAGRLRRGNGHHRVRPQRFEGRGDHAGRSSSFESTTTR